MKNKRLKESESRKRHKEKLKSDKEKKRRDAPILSRTEPTKVEKPTILIVCEGKNTEPSYFTKFRLVSATIETVGEGKNTVSLVNQAIELSKKRSYDQVWCVFDKDDFTANNFNSAITKAIDNGLKVAYSNQAFEYWVVLHFEDHQGAAIKRSDYNAKINNYLKPFGIFYDGKGCKEITSEIFDVLLAIDDKTNEERTKLAIKRAERNYNRLDHKSPAIEESTTTVFKLVEEILKYI